MTNPLLLFRAMTPRRPRRRRRPDVEIPTTLAATDALFLALRRMRAPIITMVAIFTVCVAGLAAIPGADGHRMTVFEAFYVASYTATTIGYGEIPTVFTTAQRLWVTLSIYLLVVGWAYAVGSLLALVQEDGFRDAVADQRFRRRVNRLAEPFVLVVGYGEAGRQVCDELDADGRRLVVVDSDRARIDRLASDQLDADVPGLEGDAAIPAVLGLAGLDHPRLALVLALTDDDATNLAVVMSTNLLRPDVPVIARVADRRTERRMLDFTPDAVINPHDRYGAYLVTSVLKPHTYQLVRWLMAPTGSRVEPGRGALAHGRWLVCADGQFGQEVAADLQAGGLSVTVVDPAAGHPDLTDIAGFLAGTDDDLTNIALAERAKTADPSTFVAIRQQGSAYASLLHALDVDSVFLPTDVVATETLARVSTPLFWSVVEHALAAPDDWSATLLDRLRERCGDATPDRTHLTLTAAQAPALARWLAGQPLTLGGLLRDPDDRSSSLPVVTLAVVRDGIAAFAPDDEHLLAVGDELLLAGAPADLDVVSGALFLDAQLEYLATGRVVPTTWIGRLLTRRPTSTPVDNGHRYR